MTWKLGHFEEVCACVKIGPGPKSFNVGDNRHLPKTPLQHYIIMMENHNLHQINLISVFI